jgi:hypothetical protein
MKKKRLIILVVLAAITLSSCNSSNSADSKKTSNTTVNSTLAVTVKNTTASAEDKDEFEEAILSLKDDQMFDDNIWNLGNTCNVLKYGDYLIFVEYDNVKDKSIIYSKKENNNNKIKVFSTNGLIYSINPKDKSTLYISIIANEKWNNVCLDLITEKTSVFKYSFKQLDKLYSYSPVWTKDLMIFEGSKVLSDEACSPFNYLFVKDKNSDGEYTELSSDWGWSYYQNKIYYTDGGNTVSVYSGSNNIKTINLNFDVDTVGSVYGNMLIGTEEIGGNKLFIYNLDSKKSVYSDVNINLKNNNNGTVAVYNNYVYCIDSKGIMYRIDAQTGRTKLIQKNIVAENISFIDGWVYFNNVSSLYSFDSGEAEMVKHDSVINLCRMKPDGSCLEVIN